MTKVKEAEERQETVFAKECYDFARKGQRLERMLQKDIKNTEFNF